MQTRISSSHAAPFGATNAGEKLQEGQGEEERRAPSRGERRPADTGLVGQGGFWSAEMRVWGELREQSGEGGWKSRGY